MILVVLAMLSMLGIVALAIDVITLYSAKSEAQRAADAGALVAAKMLVDAGRDGQTPAMRPANYRANDRNHRGERRRQAECHRWTSDYWT